jgi:hypothetical protein
VAVGTLGEKRWFACVIRLEKSVNKSVPSIHRVYLQEQHHDQVGILRNRGIVGAVPWFSRYDRTKTNSKQYNVIKIHRLQRILHKVYSANRFYALARVTQRYCRSVEVKKP